MANPANPSKDPRSCGWFSGPATLAISVDPISWWIALTRQPSTTRFRTKRNSSLQFMCQQKTRR